MKYVIALVLLAACPAFAWAEVSNLNPTSNLIDEGIEPEAAPATVLDGIPLMQGLQLAADQNVIDILPGGGKAQPTVAVGILDVDDIYNFYKRELPPLGWKATGSRDYMRGNETLHIDAHADGKLSTVTFTETAAAP